MLTWAKTPAIKSFNDNMRLHMARLKLLYAICWCPYAVQLQLLALNNRWTADSVGVSVINKHFVQSTYNSVPLRTVTYPHFLRQSFQLMTNDTFLPHHKHDKTVHGWVSDASPNVVLPAGSQHFHPEKQTSTSASSPSQIGLPKPAQAKVNKQLIFRHAIHKQHIRRNGAKSLIIVTGH